MAHLDPLPLLRRLPFQSAALALSGKLAVWSHRSFSCPECTRHKLARSLMSCVTAVLHAASYLDTVLYFPAAA